MKFTAQLAVVLSMFLAGCQSAQQSQELPLMKLKNLSSQQPGVPTSSAVPCRGATASWPMSPPSTNLGLYSSADLKTWTLVTNLCGPTSIEVPGSDRQFFTIVPK